MPNIIQDKRYRVPDRSTTPFTIALIGKAIKDGSSYIPLRNHAAAIAAEAPRKDYGGQLKRVWNSFLKSWRYVRDPYGTETVATHPRVLMNLVIGKNGGAGRGLGVGDCDDATAAIGALLMSIGFPVRIATTAPPGHPGLGFTHVFAQAYTPGVGWVTMDPVLAPHGTIGDIAPHGRLAIWSLKGDIIATRGVSPSALKRAFKMQRSNRNVKRKRSLPGRRPINPGRMRS